MSLRRPLSHLLLTTLLLMLTCSDFTPSEIIIIPSQITPPLPTPPPTTSATPPPSTTSSSSVTSSSSPSTSGAGVLWCWSSETGVDLVWSRPGLSRSQCAAMALRREAGFFSWRGVCEVFALFTLTADPQKAGYVPFSESRCRPEISLPSPVSDEEETGVEITPIGDDEMPGSEGQITIPRASALPASDELTSPLRDEATLPGSNELTSSVGDETTSLATSATQKTSTIMEETTPPSDGNIVPGSRPGMDETTAIGTDSGDASGASTKPTSGTTPTGKHDDAEGAVTSPPTGNDDAEPQTGTAGDDPEPAMAPSASTTLTGDTDAETTTVPAGAIVPLFVYPIDLGVAFSGHHGHEHLSPVDEPILTIPEPREISTPAQTAAEATTSVGDLSGSSLPAENHAETSNTETANLPNDVHESTGYQLPSSTTDTTIPSQLATVTLLDTTVWFATTIQSSTSRVSTTARNADMTTNGPTTTTLELTATTTLAPSSTSTTPNPTTDSTNSRPTAINTTPQPTTPESTTTTTPKPITTNTTLKPPVTSTTTTATTILNPTDPTLKSTMAETSKPSTTAPAFPVATPASLAACPSGYWKVLDNCFCVTDHYAVEAQLDSTCTKSLSNCDAAQGALPASLVTSAEQEGVQEKLVSEITTVRYLFLGGKRESASSAWMWRNSDPFGDYKNFNGKRFGADLGGRDVILIDISDGGRWAIMSDNALHFRVLCKLQQV